MLGWGLESGQSRIGYVPTPSVMKFKNMHFDRIENFLFLQKMLNICIM